MKQKAALRLLVFIVICVSSINAGVDKNNDKSRPKKFFDFTDFVLNRLEDIIHKNVIYNLNDDCLMQLRKLGESIQKNDDWALAGNMIKKNDCLKFLKFNLKQ